MIVDPTDPTRAIAPSGQMATRVFFIPATDDPASMTPTELEDAIASGGAVQLGWADPESMFGAS